MKSVPTQSKFFSNVVQRLVLLLFLELIEDILRQHLEHIFHVHLDYYQWPYEEQRIWDLNCIVEEVFLEENVQHLMLFQATFITRK